MKNVNKINIKQNVIMAEESKIIHSSVLSEDESLCPLPKKPKLSSLSENCRASDEKYETVKNKETRTNKTWITEKCKSSSKDIVNAASSSELSCTESVRLVARSKSHIENEYKINDCTNTVSSKKKESSAICEEFVKTEEYNPKKNMNNAGDATGGKEDDQKNSLTGEHASYRDLSLIGNGAYGTVYKAKDLTSGQFVALKKVRVPLTEDGLPISTLREIATLKQLERFEHPHIVKLLDVCQGNNLDIPTDEERSGSTVDHGLTLWLVFEHIEQDLASYIASCSTVGIPSRLVNQMSQEILLGVDFLHSHRIIHRDLKPQNLLVTREGRIKIADFGLAKTYDFEMRLTSVVVTLWYRAPEVLLGCTYATPVDIWSVGCILAELNRLRPLFPGSSEGDQLDRIFQVIGMPSKNQWPDNVSLSWTAFPQRLPKPLHSVIPNVNDEGLDLIKNTLTFNPHNRISAAQALQHAYFKNNVYS